MIRTWTFFIILSLFPIFIFSQQQSNRLISKKDSLLPGMSTSIPFTLENNSAENRTYDISVSTSNPQILPILTKGEFQIAPHETSVYLVPLRIATETSQGTYTVTLNITDRNNGISFTKISKVTVSGNRNISLTALNSPEFVKAGETIKANFLIKNNGNIPEKLILESKNAIIDQDSEIFLSPGETKQILISRKTDPQLGKNEFQNLNLTVYSSDDPKESETAYASVKVISIQPSEDDIYHRLPVSASLAFIGMRNRGDYNDGFQGEIYGKGSLDKNNKGQIEFHVATKNPVEYSSFTQYEEYFVNYKRDHFLIHLGDKTYSSSFLTEYSRYGRGAEVRFDINKVSIGGFYNHPRFFRDIKDEFNVYSKFKIKKESEITAGYLYKIPRKEENVFAISRLDSNAHLPYLTGKFQISKNLNLLGEVSYSKTNKTEGTAYMIQAQANFERLNGNVMYMRSSPEFAGYFTNTSTFNGGLQYRISKRLNITANFVQDAKNFERDTLLLAAPYRKFLQYGIQYSYTSKGTVMLYSGYQKYQDRLEPKQFDYDERFYRLAINQKIGNFQINVEGQLGKTDNYLTGFSGTSRLYTANIGFEKFKTSFNLYGSYAVTSRYQLKNQRQVYYGANIISHFSPKTYLSFLYQNNYMPEYYFKDRNLLELLFHQQLFPGHEFDISGRYTLQRGDLANKDFIFSLRYTLRLNVPVQKIAEYTTLSGNIGNMGVKKISEVKLMLGSHLTITDKDGNFIFKNITPGDYYLEMDRSTTEINDIPTVALPASVSLHHKENIFNFGLTRAAKIQGHIQFTEPVENDQINSIQKRKKESIIIEAISGEQTYRKICFIGEDFDFTYLRPGDWTVKIYRNGLDKRYKISTNQFQFTLKPEEIKKLNINIVKQQTEIKYQQETLKVGYNEIKKQK
ncbi:hypothetical protein [Chryseobacterium aurantiacum]|uniref:hypothetical protein n=1 Tax=Chryseobacterium aurantiacum TaxID=2116499 RepID=UPI000D11F2E8|nr:hypothetical protein [Chryseobacterium aurantiacum]